MELICRETRLIFHYSKEYSWYLTLKICLRRIKGIQINIISVHLWY